jgi:hypothetical protein
VTASANTYSRKRAVFYSALEYAIEQKRLDANPVQLVKRRRRYALEQVDPRTVINDDQARPPRRHP